MCRGVEGGQAGILGLEALSDPTVDSITPISRWVGVDGGTAAAV